MKTMIKGETMKKVFKITFILSLVLVALVACTGPKEGSDLKKVTLALDWTPNTNHTGIFVAKDKGYFKDLGIDLEIVQAPEDGAEALTASNKAQFGISFQDSIAPAFAKEDPLPVTAIAGIIQHNTSGIVSLKGGGMDRPSGLVGKKYATWDLPVEKKILETVVQRDGGDFSKIEMIPTYVTDVVSGLKTDIDAVWIFYGWDGIALETKNIPTDFFLFKDIDETFDYYTPILIGNNDFLKENKDLTRDILSSIKKGYEFAVENPEQAGKILIKYAPELDEDMVINSQNYLAKEYISDASSWGYIDPTRWNNFYSWLFANNLIEKEIPENFGFTNEFLD